VRFGLSPGDFLLDAGMRADAAALAAVWNSLRRLSFAAGWRRHPMLRCWRWQIVLID